MSAPTRWEPDDQLVPAVLASVRAYRMSALAHPDRCWVVAGLTLAGLTAEDIAERLACSLRLVRALRADDMTQVCLRIQRETHAFRDELRLLDTERRALRVALDARTVECDHLRAQVRRLIAPPEGPRCGRGHEMTKYNTYERGGRRWCRECHRERQALYRAARRTEKRDAALP